MRPLSISGPRRIRGSLRLRGDKSISHRSIIISAISEGNTQVDNFPSGKDCLATLSVIKKFGVRIKIISGSRLVVSGVGLKGLKRPRGSVFVGESGTTLRIILGVLSGTDFTTRLTGKPSLSARPMLRVTGPLRMMGARVRARRYGRRREEYLPISIHGARLKPLSYKLPVASAQVKSALLLAGLYTKGK
ncbi:3-phosphoshikimate 1-carboxyvinyltransferase, partial [Candidatus Omnitrophota bacterium]